MSNTKPDVPKPTYVYNGFDDLKLKFDGRVFEFAFGSTTKIEDLYCWTHKESDWQQTPNPNPPSTERIEKVYPAREFALRLFNRHNENLIEARCVIVSDKEPTVDEKRKADIAGVFRKKKIVEEALADRKAALAKGGRPELAPKIVDWMIEYGINDETYNPKPQDDIRRDLVSVLREAMHPELAGAKK